MRAAVSLVQVASPPDESLAARRERAAALIRERATGADLAVLPELRPGGFAIEDWQDPQAAAEGS